jgi:type II secretory pathway component GspD/PulD (secretin)
VQIVALPKNIAIPLVEDFGVQTKIEATCQKVQKLLADGTARLIGWPMLLTQSGQRAQIENVDEVRYPTEFDAGGLAVHIDDKDGMPTKEHLNLRGVESHPIPTSFETRKTGVTLEVEPLISEDGQMISLNLVPQHVRLIGMKKHTVELKGDGSVVVEQPDFDTKKLQTSLRVRNGGHVLLGTFTTEAPPDHLELFILKAETRFP